ncbi:MAG: hypothetical protein U0X39_03390 [Bacteroidales bacterium]
MKTKCLSFIIVLMIIPGLANAQLGGLLKKGASKMLNSVGKAATKEAGNEIDSAAQKQADKTVNNAAESNQQSAGENQTDAQPGKGLNMGGLFGGKVTLKYNDEYKFSSRMYMVMELYDKKDVVNMDYFIYFNSNTPMAGMEMKTVGKSEGDEVPLTTQIIMDGENKCFMMLTDINGMKMGMISEVPDENTVPAEQGAQPKEPVVTKTGNTKVIAGYKCDEYTYKEADKKEWSKLWMTKESNLNIDRRVWSNSQVSGAYGYAGFKGMVAMGWEQYDSKNVLAAKSEVKEVNLNFSHSMSPKGYSLRQMNLKQMQQQNQKK